LKAHEEDLAPRPKRPQRRQRGKDAIANQEAKLEAHTVTSGETAIDDAPVLNEGVISETEKPKRARRGRRGSRRENMAPEILETNEKEQVIVEAVEVSETESLSQSDASVAVKDSTATQEASSEDRPKGKSRGKGRPRKDQTKTDTSESDKINAIAKADEITIAISDENPSAENERQAENVKTPNKKPARSKRVKEAPEDTIDKVAPDTAVSSSEKKPKPAAAIVEGNEADKPKRIRGRGRRGSPELPDASPTPSVTDLRAQLVEDGADSKAPTSDARNRSKQRGRGRPRKSAPDDNSASEATETK
jgi:ribonuclease E